MIIFFNVYTPGQKPREWQGAAIFPTSLDTKRIDDIEYPKYPRETEGLHKDRMHPDTVKKFERCEEAAITKREVTKKEEQKVIVVLLESLAPDMWDNIANIVDHEAILGSNDLHAVWPLLITASATEGVYKALKSLTDLCGLRMIPGQHAGYAKLFREHFRLFKLNFESPN